VRGRVRARRTGDSEDNGHEDPDKVVDDFEHGPFLGAKELPGPWGENEGVPSGDGQGAHEEVLVGGQVGWKLEGVWKEACVRFAVSSGETCGRCGDALIMSAMAARGRDYNGGGARRERERGFE